MSLLHIIAPLILTWSQSYHVTDPTGDTQIDATFSVDWGRGTEYPTEARFFGLVYGHLVYENEVHMSLSGIRGKRETLHLNFSWEVDGCVFLAEFTMVLWAFNPVWRGDLRKYNSDGELISEVPLQLEGV